MEEENNRNLLQERFLNPLKRNFLQAQMFGEYENAMKEAQGLDKYFDEYKAATTDEERKRIEQLWTDKDSKVEEKFNAIRKKAEDISLIPLSEEEQRMSDAMSKGELSGEDWAAVASAWPELAANIGGQVNPLVQGAIASGAGAAVGGVPGAVIGGGGRAISTFIDSQRQNKVGSLISNIADAGLDPMNYNQVLGYLNSEGGKAMLSEVERGANTRAVGDSISAMIAGGKPKVGAGVLQKMGGAAKDTLLKQVPFAAGTEVAGQVAEKGRVYQPGQVLAESIGELPGGAMESVMGGFQKQAQVDNSARFEQGILDERKKQEAGRAIVEARKAKMVEDGVISQDGAAQTINENIKQSVLPLTDEEGVAINTNYEVNPLAQKEQEAKLGTTGAEIVAADKNYGPWSNFMERIVDGWQRVKQTLPNTWKNESVFKSQKAQREGEVIGSADDVIRKTLKRAKTIGVTEEQLIADGHNYAVARHALDINKIHGEGASGKTNEQAIAAMQAISQSPQGAAALSIADELVKVRKAELDIAEKGGFITKEFADKLRKIYPNSVPFYRVEEEAATIKNPRKMRDFSGKNPIKFISGSDKDVKNVLETTISSFKSTNDLAYKKQVFESVMDEIRANPYLRKFVEVVDETSGTDLNAKNIMAIKQADKTYYLKINDTKLAEQLNGANKDAIPELFSMLGKATSFMGANFTRRVPFFGLITGLYDIVEGSINASKDFGASKLPSFYKHYATGLGIALNEARLGNNPANVAGMRSKPDARTVQLYKRAIRAGALTGGPMNPTDQDKQTIAMVQYAKVRSNPLVAQALSLFEHIENFNSVSDNATRFAAFATALEQGKSDLEAAAMAQNITVNFNRKGTWGRLIGSMYAFVNAGLQGSRRMFNTMFVGKDGKFDPKGFVAFMSAAVVMHSMIQAYNDAVEPDWEQLKDNDLKRNIVIAMGDGKFMRLPTPWGVRTFSYMAHTMAKGLRGKDVNIEASDLASMFGLAVEAYSPLGGGDIVQMVTPTVFDPVVDIARNTSYTGRPIEPERKHGVERANIPVAERFYQDLENSFLGRSSIAASEALDATKVAHISPAQLHYLMNGYLGGTIKFPAQMMGTAQNALAGERLQPIDLPIVSRFYSELTPDDRNRLLERKSSKGELGAMKETQSQIRQEQYYRSKEADGILKKLTSLGTAQQAEELKKIRLRDRDLYENVVNKLHRTEKEANMTLEGLAMSKLNREARLAYISSKLAELGSAEEREAYVNKLVRGGGIIPDRRNKDSDYNLILRALIKMKNMQDKTDATFLSSMRSNSRQ